MLQLLKFSSNFYEILHNYSKDIIKTHDYCFFFVILGENVVFEQKQFYLSKPHAF